MYLKAMFLSSQDRKELIAYARQKLKVANEKLERKVEAKERARFLSPMMKQLYEHQINERFNECERYANMIRKLGGRVND